MSTSTTRPAVARRGFTLVELLVVIGIIALLIGILLPTLSQARNSAKDIVCQSNMRQQGMGILLYADAHKQSLPYGYWDGSPAGSFAFDATKAGDWPLLILSYIVEGAAAENYEDNAEIGNNNARTLFRCSQGLVSNEAVTQYSAHPRLMPALDARDDLMPSGEYYEPYKLAQIANAAGTLVVADGTLWNIPDGTEEVNYGANAVLYAMDEGRLAYDHYMLTYKLDDWLEANPDRKGEHVRGGTNVDDQANWGNLKFRHGGASDNTDGSAVNILYGDGHVAAQRHAGFLPDVPGQLDTNIDRRSIAVPGL